MTSSTLSLQLYTVREALSTDLRSALERVAELGLRQGEPFGFVERAEEYAALLPQVGLSAPSAHAYLLDGQAPAAFTAARRIGIGTVISPWSTPEPWTPRDGVEAIADELNGLVEEATQAGLRIGYHNHWWELEDLDGTPALEVFAARLAPGGGLGLDTYWAARG